MMTMRHAQVLALLANGFTQDQVADELHYSGYTVKTHLREVKVMLGASTVTQAVATAIRRGILVAENFGKFAVSEEGVRGAVHEGQQEGNGFVQEALWHEVEEGLLRPSIEAGEG
jgi:DNA-binding CsgD family transcriptional regulator